MSLSHTHVLSLFLFHKIPVILKYNSPHSQTQCPAYTSSHKQTIPFFLSKMSFYILAHTLSTFCHSSSISHSLLSYPVSHPSLSHSLLLFTRTISTLLPYSLTPSHQISTLLSQSLSPSLTISTFLSHIVILITFISSSYSILDTFGHFTPKFFTYFYI